MRKQSIITWILYKITSISKTLKQSFVTAIYCLTWLSVSDFAGFPEEVQC